MPKIDRFGIPTVLRMFGSECTALTKDGPLEFRGVYEVIDTETATDSGMSIVHTSETLSVTKDIAARLPNGTRIRLDGKEYQSRAPLSEEGYMVRLHIVTLDRDTTCYSN